MFPPLPVDELLLALVLLPDDGLVLDLGETEGAVRSFALPELTGLEEDFSGDVFCLLLCELLIRSLAGDGFTLGVCPVADKPVIINKIKMSVFIKSFLL